MKDSENADLKARREMAEQEARGSTIGAPSLQAEATVSNPGDKDATPEGSASGELPSGLRGTGIPAAGGVTITESASTGQNRTTRETGDHVRK